MNRTSRKAERGPEWAIAVRIADGDHLYYLRGPDGLERWSLRDSEALRFATEEEAVRVAGTFQTNGAAKEYAVVRVGPAASG